MTKSDLSVWVLPRGRASASETRSSRAKHMGAFVVASCGNADMALTPEAPANINRRIWPLDARTSPRVISR